MEANEKREEILVAVREKGKLEIEIGGINLDELRQIHQILFEEAIRVGREELGEDFEITVLKKRIDNAVKHIRDNMCTNPVEFCNRKNCDNYDSECVTRKIEDQMNTLVSEICQPSSRLHLLA